MTLCTLKVVFLFFVLLRLFLCQTKVLNSPSHLLFFIGVTEPTAPINLFIKSEYGAFTGAQLEFFRTGEVSLNWGISINISLKTKKGPTGKNFGLYSSRHPKSIFISNFCNFVAKYVFALKELIYVKVIKEVTRLGFWIILLTKDLIYTIVNRRYKEEIT